MNIYNLIDTMIKEHKTIFDMQLKVTYYVRVSTQKEEQLNSRENQLQVFTKMIEDNPNWTLVGGYVDTIRGESAANRENFLKMIEDAKSGMFDLIICKEISRFSRDLLDSIGYTRELFRNNVGVFFSSDNLCTIDKDSELRLSIMASIAQQEVARLSERVKFGHKQSIQKGVVLGNNRIFGYDKKDKKLVINEKEAEMVRLIYELYQTGEYSVKSIERLLYDKGYRGRNGNRIHHNTISGIIQNPKYKGFYCGNKTKIEDYRTKKQIFLEQSEWIIYKDTSGAVPAIVDEDIWDRCNEIFKKRSDIVKSREHSIKNNSVLTGKIWCASHDVPYWRTSYSNSVRQGIPRYQWICSEKKKNGTSTCSSVAIMEDELYQMLREYFINLTDNIDECINQVTELYKKTSLDSDYTKELDKYEKEIKRLSIKKDKLLDLYVDGIIQKDEFQTRNEEFNQQIILIESDRSCLLDKINITNNIDAEIQKIKNYFKKAFDKENDINDTVVDELIDVLIDHILVTPINQGEMKLSIKLKIGNESDIKYVRKGSRYGCRSDIITKKMIPQQQWQFHRNNVRCNNHKQQIKYHLEIGI